MAVAIESGFIHSISITVTQTDGDSCIGQDKPALLRLMELQLQEKGFRVQKYPPNL